MFNLNCHPSLFISLSNLNKKIATSTFCMSSYKNYQNHLRLERMKNYKRESKILLDVHCFRPRHKNAHRNEISFERQNKEFAPGNKSGSRQMSVE